MYYLISFAARSPEYLYNMLGKATREVLLDSGAFSVNNKNIPKWLSLEGYDKFLSRLPKRDNIRTINFDVIGDGRKSLENYKRLKKHGVIPVYQWGANLKDLDYYLDQSDLVCIGGLVGKGLFGKMSLYRAIEKRYKKKIFRRLHLLGVGSHTDEFINRYEPYSTDSMLLNPMAGYKKTAIFFDKGYLKKIKLDQKSHNFIQSRAINYKYSHLLKIYQTYKDQKLQTVINFSLDSILKYQEHFAKKNPPTKIHSVIGTNKLFENLVYT